MNYWKITFLSLQKVKLKEQGSSIDESDQVFIMLLSLPSNYDTVIPAVETIAAMKIDSVKSRLLDE